MHTTIRQRIGLGLIAIVAALSVAAPAWSDDRGREGHDRDRHDDRGRDRDEHRERPPEHRVAVPPPAQREWARRQELDRHRAAATWRFENGRGWRHYNAGVWSPFQVWWWIGGHAYLRPVPTVRVVTYPTGRYELLGDGITVPFYWVWRPTVIIAGPPPPLPAPPPVVAPGPPDYAYPPPPPPPPAG